MQGDEQKEDEEFAIVFAAMGVNMETAHFFKQARCSCMHATHIPADAPCLLSPLSPLPTADMTPVVAGCLLLQDVSACWS